MFKKIVSLSLMLTSQIAGAFTYTMEITEQELQNRISAMMPLEKQKRLYSVVISDPEINLIKESNEVGMFANIEAVILGRLKGNGRARVEGSISYESKKGAFYLKDAKIISLVIDKVPKNYDSIIMKITQKALTKLLAKNPIYKFKDDDMKHKLAKTFLESVQVKDERLLIKLSSF